MDFLEKTLDAGFAELIDAKTFNEVCANYHELFNMPIRVFDQEGNLVSESAHALPVCEYLTTFDAGRHICDEIRREVKGIALEGDDMLHLDCVCSLTYAIAPIRFQGKNLGKIVFGPYLPSSVEQVPQKLLALDSNVEKKVIRDLLAEMRGVSKIAIKRIVAAMIAVIDVILFNAHKAYVTNEMHMESIRESYRELTEKNRQLEEMNEHIHEFERLKANFLSTVSHELRTPLTSIIGYSDMLFEGLAGELGQEQKQFVQTIKTKGDELLKLISSILDFSRFETGHLNLRRLDIDPKELVEKSVANNVDLAKRRGIRLLLDVPNALPTVSVDPERIETAIDHLIENAIKFSTPGAMVKVSAEISPPDEDATEDDGFGFVLMASPEMLEISVEDWGIGISENEQDQIFAPFGQIDNSSTREQGGAGLGLAVVKHFVEAHGGQVKIRSRAGEGSRFSLWLPMIKEAP